MALVYVHVARDTLRILDLEDGSDALGDMAFGAGYSRVLAFQGVAGRSMLLDAEDRRFESVHVMTGGAIPAIGPLFELPAVRVGFMAVGTFLVCHGLLEIAQAVTLAACYGLVLAQQRKTRS